MSEGIKCENCGTLVHEDRISPKMKDFEVGKFYAVNVRPAYGDSPVKYVAALCTRVLKKKVEFQYISRNEKGERLKYKVVRGLWAANEYHPAETYIRGDKWSMIRQTTADMEAKKPSIWDAVPENKTDKGGK